jgi:hypothetical protein
MEQRSPGAGRVVDFRPLPTLSSCDHGNSLNGSSALAPATFRMSGIEIRSNVRRWPMTDQNRLRPHVACWGEVAWEKLKEREQPLGPASPIRSGETTWKTSVISGITRLPFSMIYLLLV